MKSDLETIKSENIQNIQYNSNGGDYMASEMDMFNENMDKLDVAIKDMAKEHIQAMHDLTEIHSKDLQQLFEIVIEDMVEFYNNLIQQREHTIDRYVKILSILLQDEMDISKPIQSLVETKHNDVAKFKKEILPLLKFKDIMLSDETPSDEKTDELMEMLKNI